MEKSWTEYNDKGITRRCFNFEKITNHNDAYFIGYMACDGSFVKGQGFPFMSVNSTDYPIIEHFNKEYSPDKRILFIGKKSSEKVNATSDVWENRFAAKSNPTFSRFGVFDYKINRRVVGIPNKFFGGYLRGVIDSDGFITVTRRKDCRTPRIRWFITHESEQFLADLQNKIDSIFQVPTTLRQHGANVWRLQAQNTVKNIELFSYLFSIDLDIYSKRKCSIVDEYMSKYYVPQALDELLEPNGISSEAADTSAERSETTGEVQPS